MMSEHRTKYTVGFVKPLKAAGGVVTPKKINSAGPNRTATATGRASVMSKTRTVSKMQKLAIAFWPNASLAGSIKLNAISAAAMSTPNFLVFIIDTP